MIKDKEGINILDYLVIFVKYKKLLVGMTFIIMVLSYTIIYFEVEEQYTAEAIIIPSDDNSFSGIAGLLGDLKNFPIGLGGASNPEIGIYNTIIYSRSCGEEIINRFDLISDYHLQEKVDKDFEKALEILKSNINAGETDDGAYIIKVTMFSPKKAANITNYIIKYLNEKIISLKIQKSINNREFLSRQLDDIKSKLKEAEDSLKYIQQTSGLMEPEEQFKGIMSAYSKIQSQLISKQIEKSILEKILEEDSPKLKHVNIEVVEYQRKVDKLRKIGDQNGLLLSLDSLPEKSMEYYRQYRNVEINSALLKVILPLYEQSKFEEQKNIPVLQIIDDAKPPAKKSFPPRSILTLLIGFGSFVLFFSLILIRENDNFMNSEKLKYIQKNLFKW